MGDVNAERPEGQSCDSCRHFIDYRDTDDEPDEMNGYCAFWVNTLGFDRALKIDAYAGGNWTHSESWCSRWEGGMRVWGGAKTS